MKTSDYNFKFQYKNAVIKKIKELRKKGATLQEISDEFNKNEYSTFSGTGKWHQQTIHRLSI